MKDSHVIVGVHLVDREKLSRQVQDIFSRYGAHIRTRLGLHDDVCSANGLILLEMCDTPETNSMMAELGAIEGVDIAKMVFDH